MLPEYLIYAPLFMVFLLEVLAIGVLVAYFSFLKKFQQVDESYRKLKKETQKHENEVLQAARVQADKVITDGQRKAELMISRAAGLSNRYAEAFQAELAKVAQDQKAAYEKVLEESRKETSLMMRQVAEETRSLSVKEVENLKVRLIEQAQQSQKALSEAIAAAFLKAEGEIETYKQERFTYIEDHLRDMLTEIARNVLPRELSVKQHEEVIMSALEEAKKDRLFRLSKANSDKAT